MLMLKWNIVNLIEQEIPVWKLLGPKDSVPKCSEWKQTFRMESNAALWRRRGVHCTKTQAESNLFRKSGTSIIPFRHSGLLLVLEVIPLFTRTRMFSKALFSFDIQICGWSWSYSSFYMNKNVFYVYNVAIQIAEQCF